MGLNCKLGLLQHLKNDNTNETSSTFARRAPSVTKTLWSSTFSALVLCRFKIWNEISRVPIDFEFTSYPNLFHHVLVVISK